MYKKFGALVLTTALLYTPLAASAHVMNSDTMFTDIGQSEEKHAILYTSALRLITSDSNLFKPNDMLSRADFAAWYASFKQWDAATAVERALEEKVIQKNDGAVTYEEVNNALFNGEVLLENATDTMTRAQYAAFVEAHAAEKLLDGSLLDQLAYEQGPTGEIEAVQEENEQYTLTIDGKPYILAEHPQVDSDTTDPRVWQGQDVVTSLLTKETVADRKGEGSKSDEAKLQYVAISELEAQSISAETEATQQKEQTTAPKAEAKKDNSSTSAILWGVGAIAVITVIGVLIMKKRGKK